MVQTSTTQSNVERYNIIPLNDVADRSFGCITSRGGNITWLNSSQPVEPEAVSDAVEVRVNSSGIECYAEPFEVPENFKKYAQGIEFILSQLNSMVTRKSSGKSKPLDKKSGFVRLKREVYGLIENSKMPQEVNAYYLQRYESLMRRVFNL